MYVLVETESWLGAANRTMIHSDSLGIFSFVSIERSSKTLYQTIKSG